MLSLTPHDAAGIMDLSMVEIALSGLSHEFDGREVFRGLDFACDQPCLAVVGPNGSGKSTLLRIIAGLLTPTAGKVSVQIDGEVIGRDAVTRAVGLAASDARLYPELSARENLRFLMRARGIRSCDVSVSDALERVGLTNRADDPVAELSSGLRQRAALAAALAHGPMLLLLDEPMTNLDEDGICLARRIIDSQRESGMVIFTATDQSDTATADARLDLGGTR